MHFVQQCLVSILIRLFVVLVLFPLDVGNLRLQLRTRMSSISDRQEDLPQMPQHVELQRNHELDFLLPLDEVPHHEFLQVLFEVAVKARVQGCLDGQLGEHPVDVLDIFQ